MSSEKPQRTDAARRSRQCERLARLMRTLQLIMGRGRWDATSLAEELGCSRRTVYRTLETLSAAGVPWYFDEKLRAYRVRPGYRTTLVDQNSVAESERAFERQETREIAKELVKRGREFSEALTRFIEQCEKISEISDDQHRRSGGGKA